MAGTGSLPLFAYFPPPFASNGAVVSYQPTVVLVRLPSTHLFTPTHSPAHPVLPLTSLRGPSRLLGYHTSRDAYTDLGAGLAERKARLRPGGMVGAVLPYCARVLHLPDMQQALRGLPMAKSCCTWWRERCTAVHSTATTGVLRLM